MCSQNKPARPVVPHAVEVAPAAEQVVAAIHVYSAIWHLWPASVDTSFSSMEDFFAALRFDTA